MKIITSAPIFIRLTLKMAPKKKLSKKDRQRIEAEKAEVLRIEQEKEKQRQIEAELKRKRLERAEAERRQKQEVQENKIRRVQLEESFEFFESFQRDVDEIHTRMRKKKEWKIYMRCNGLPDPASPCEIRKYIRMWREGDANEQMFKCNWLLSTDETSVLTQDRRVANMTRSHLKDQQNNDGDMVAKRVRDVLGILREIEFTIHDSEHLPIAVRMDIDHLKYVLRSTLHQYIDEFSFRVLSNIDRDMELEGFTIARHKFDSDVFKMQQWTIREAPDQPKNPKELAKLETSHTEVEFPMLQIEVTLPPPVNCMNTALRVLWLNYDHFSDYCPSYIIPNAHIMKQDDICRTARREWRKRKELLKKALDDEDTIREPITQNSETEIIIPTTNVMDADKLYANFEIQQTVLQREQIGPEHLKLKEFDINMRKNRIVGGVFYVQHFEQPQQDVKIEEKRYLRNIVQPNTLHAIPFHQTYKPPKPVLPGVRRLPEEIEAELREVEANLDRLGSVNIKLTDDIIWFEPPIVCRWESCEETLLAEQAALDTLSDIAHGKIGGGHEFEEGLTILDDFNVLHPPAGMNMQTIIRQFVVPRMPDGFTIRLDRKNIGNSQEFNIRSKLKPSNSPRPLFPSVELAHELRIIEPAQKSSLIPDDRKVYMFSKLLNDLDELCDELVPYVDRRLEDMSEDISLENEMEQDEMEDETEPEPDYMSMSFLRSGEFPWMVSKAEPEQKPTTSDVEDDDSDQSQMSDSNSVERNVETRNAVGKWSTRDVHDVKFNEEKLSIQFKFGRLGAFALVINWYNNFPFQTWELKPDPKDPDDVLFNLTGSVISIEVTVINEGFVLNSYQGGQSTIVQDLIGKTLKLHQLKGGLARAAINLFPESDAVCYTDNTCEKNAVMESHLYKCMAALGLTYNFSWSRWNLAAGRRACVLLMREIIENQKAPSYSTLHVTPQKATLVDCTDVSSAFSAKCIDGIDFHADLYHLSRQISQPESLEKQTTMDALQRQNVYDLLQATRPLSFS